MKTHPALRFATPLVQAALVTAACLPPSLTAGIFYDENSGGDLSGIAVSPTSGGSLIVGDNTLSGSTLSGDVDYLTFTVPTGAALTSMTLTSFASTDDVAFLGITSGTIGGTAGGGAGSLLGYSHFGTGGLAGTALVGTDILDEIGAGPGSQGFTPPLAAGTYTLWIQQTQGDPVSYAFNLTAVPEPGETAFAVGLLLGGTAWVRRLRKRTA